MYLHVIPGRSTDVVCVCLCMYVTVCMHGCMLACLLAWMYMYIHMERDIYAADADTHPYEHACIHPCRTPYYRQADRQTEHAVVPTQTADKHVNLHACTHIYICLRTSHVCIFIYICIHMYLYFLFV